MFKIISFIALIGIYKQSDVVKKKKKKSWGVASSSWTSL